MTYQLSQRAEADLLALYLDGVMKHGTERAESYFAGLTKQFQILTKTPRIFHERTEINPPVRICPYGVHIIIYLIRDDESVFIVRIRHEREDW